ESLAAALAGDRFAPETLSESELSVCRARNLDEAPDVVRADCPDWCAPLLQATYGDGWVREGAALASRPPLDLRANRLKSDRGKVLAELAENGAAAVPFAADAIRIPPIEGSGRHPNVQAEPAFRKGW